MEEKEMKEIKMGMVKVIKVAVLLLLMMMKKKREDAEAKKG